MTRLRALTSILAVVAVAIGLVAGASGTASANTRTEVDVRGDAPRGYDITEVTYRYDGKGAHARVHVRDLRRKGELVFVVMNRSHNLRYGLAVTRHRNGSQSRAFYRYRDGDVVKRSCQGSHVKWKRKADVVTLSFPKRCFGKLGKKVAMAVGSTRQFPNGVTVDDGPVSTLRR